MPNYVANVLKAEGIRELPIYSDNSEGWKQLDFNKLIPMPEELDIDSGTISDLENGLPAFAKSVRWLQAHGFLELPSDLRTMGKSDLPLKISLKDFENPEVTQNLDKVSEILHRKWFTDLSFRRMLEKGDRYLSNVEKYGYPTWFDWCVDKWGTKWNACQTKFPPKRTDLVYFETAWRAPLPVILELSKQYPDREFILYYADEDTGRNAGVLAFSSNGVFMESVAYDSIRDLELAHYCWNCSNKEEPALDREHMTEVKF